MAGKGRGVRKTPEEHRADGTFRSNRHTGLGEAPERNLIEPKIPKALSSPAARELWKQLMRPDVCERGWFAESDRTILIRFCETWGHWLEMKNYVSENGCTDEEGRQRPEVRQMNIANDQCTVLEKRLGIGPIASKSIGIDQSQRQLNHGLPALEKPRILVPPPETA